MPPLRIRWFLLCLAILAYVILFTGAVGRQTPPEQPVERIDSNIEAAAYTRSVFQEKDKFTLRYGDPSKVKDIVPVHASDEMYSAFVKSMPVMCVDTLLQRTSDQKVLLLKRVREPVKGVYWWPGGRLFFGESFFDASARLSSKDTGLTQVRPQRVLGTWSTVFEKSAWDGVSHTVNVLVHALVDDADAELAICGDRQAKCADGTHGNYKWVSLTDDDQSLDKYVQEGFHALRDVAAPLVV